MENKFKQGDTVILGYDQDDEYCKYNFTDDIELLKGSILDQSASESTVIIQLDAESANELLTYFSLNALDPFEISKDFLLLESEYLSLDEARELSKKEISKKIKNAASLILEAQEIADKNQLGYLNEMWELVRPLVSAMDQSGWSSSSWGC